MGAAPERSGPVIVIDEKRARANIARMADRARTAGVRLRPHVKTHQSPTIAGWLRDVGVTAITVSSVSMAARFAAAGWNDITVAIPLNPRELGRCERLAAAGVRLGLLADHPETAASIAGSGFADLWLKVDCGYGRAGVRWDDAVRLERRLPGNLEVPLGDAVAQHVPGFEGEQAHGEEHRAEGHREEGGEDPVAEAVGELDRRCRLHRARLW